MKKIFTLLFILPLVTNAQLFVDDFNYSTGQLTSAGSGANVSGGNWASFSGTGNYIPVIAGNLTYPNYSTSASVPNNKIQVIYSTSSSEDIRRTFTPVTSGTVYCSFLINVANTTGLGPNSGNGDYFFSFYNVAGTNTGYKGNIMIRQGVGANTFQLGVRPTTAAGTINFSTTDLALNTTHLVVLKYEIVTGTANDIISLFLNPTLPGAEPAVSATSTAIAADAEPSQIDGIAIRQNNSSGVGTPNAEIDNIRVSTGWFNAPLPVSVLSFNAALNNKIVNLDWSTANEVNAGSFELERSVNGKDFGRISTVSAKNAMLNNYNFVDERAVAGTNYYRLKVIDKDGSFKYSQIVSVKAKSEGVSVFPNPVKGNLTVQHEAAVKGATISVIDFAGKQVASVNVQSGATQTNLDASKFTAGSYMVIYNNDGVKLTKQFVKQ